MKLKKFSRFGLVLVLFSLISCGQKSGGEGIELQLKILPETLTDLLYVKMTYQFNFTDEFKGLNDEYKVFVHFWRQKTKEMLFQDDHSPEKPFSQWKKGESLTYSRTVFIPQFLDEFDIDFDGSEEIKLTIGLYNPAQKESKIILDQEVLKVAMASYNAPEKVYDEGWHEPETDPKIKDPDEQTWRWTGKRAVCIIENRRKDCLLIIRGGVDKSIIPDQKVIFKINDKVLDEFIPESAKFSRKYIITPEMMGTEDEFKLIIETDKTFIPSELNKEVKDDRELGIQIFFLYFRENIQ
jgi:hypothetical protein